MFAWQDFFFIYIMFVSCGMGQTCFFSALARMADIGCICGKIFFDKHLLKTFSIMLCSGNLENDFGLLSIDLLTV